MKHWNQKLLIFALTVHCCANARGWQEKIFPFRGDGADALAATDFDNDGFIDVIAGWSQSGEVVFFKNPGEGQTGNMAKWKSVQLNNDKNLRGLEDTKFIDLDNDGNAEGALTAVEREINQLFFHTLKPGQDYLNPNSWVTSAIKAPGGGYTHVQVLDLDGDNRPEIIATTKNTPAEGGGVYLFQTSGSISSPTQTWTRTLIGATTNAKSIEVMDVDGDGDSDIVYAGPADSAWFSNPHSTNQPIAQPWRKTEFSRGTYPLALCDVNQDKKIDIVVAQNPQSSGGVIGQWFEVSEGGAMKPHPIKLEAGKTPWKKVNNFKFKGLACASFGKDKFQTIVFTAIGSGVGVFSAHSSNPNANLGFSWQAIAPSRDVMKYDPPIIVDVDADGDLDILTVEEDVGNGSKGLGAVFYEND